MITTSHIGLQVLFETFFDGNSKSLLGEEEEKLAFSIVLLQDNVQF